MGTGAASASSYGNACSAMASAIAAFCSTSRTDSFSCATSLCTMPKISSTSIGASPSEGSSSMASAFATFARGDALDYQVREQSQDVFAIDVTGCRYAEFYKELGEPELGFLLVCSADFLMANLDLCLPDAAIGRAVYGRERGGS